MREIIFLLSRGNESAESDHLTGAMRKIGLHVTFLPGLPEREKLPSACIVVAEGTQFADTIIKLVESGRKDISLIGLFPGWAERVRSQLHSIEFPVLIISGESDLSTESLAAMKYHDRISGSTVKYLRGKNHQFDHPDRLARIVEAWINEQ